MFYKEIDKNNKDQMIDYLVNHFRYYTMNSWNQAKSYANNVKVYNLDLTDSEKDKFMEIYNDEDLSPTISSIISTHIDEFQEKTGYSAGLNGRSYGYMVLYDAKMDLQTRQLIVTPGRSIDTPLTREDIESYSEDYSEEDIMAWLRSRTTLVQQFDAMCDDILADIKNLMAEYDIKEYTQTITVNHRQLVPKNNTPETENND